MMTQKLPQTTCKMCGAPDCNDWMYHAGLISADQAICGACKFEIGTKIYDSMINKIGKIIARRKRKK